MFAEVLFKFIDNYRVYFCGKSHYNESSGVSYITKWLRAECAACPFPKKGEVRKAKTMRKTTGRGHYSTGYYMVTQVYKKLSGVVYAEDGSFGWASNDIVLADERIDMTADEFWKMVDKNKKMTALVIMERSSVLIGDLFFVGRIVFAHFLHSCFTCHVSYITNYFEREIQFFLSVFPLSGMEREVSQ